MDEQENTAKDELNLATEEDEIADTEQSDTDGQETETSDEQEQDTLDLEEEAPKEKGKADAARERLVNDWAKKIKGEVKTLDDIPRDQSWLVPLVEAKLGVKQNPTDAVRQVLAEERAEEKFNALKGELEDMGLDKVQKAKLEEKYKAFRAKNLPKLDALEVAMELLGIDPREHALDAKRYAMRMRTPGGYSKPSAADPAEIHDQGGYAEVAKNVPADKRFEYLKKLIKK